VAKRRKEESAGFCIVRYATFLPLRKQKRREEKRREGLGWVCFLELAPVSYFIGAAL